MIKLVCSLLVVFISSYAAAQNQQQHAQPPLFKDKRVVKMTVVNLDVLETYPFLVLLAFGAGLPEEGCIKSNIVGGSIYNIHKNPSILAAAQAMSAWLVALSIPLKAANDEVSRWCEGYRKGPVNSFDYPLHYAKEMAKILNASPEFRQKQQRLQRRK